MTRILLMALIYLIPLSVITFFVVSLCSYISAKNRYNTDPCDFNGQKKQTSKILLIVSSIIMGILLAVVIGFIALMCMAVQLNLTAH